MDNPLSSSFSYQPSLKTRLESYLPALGALSILLAVTITTFLIVDGIAHPAELKIQASGGQATISFVPPETVIDTENGGSVMLWITSNNKVVFAHVSCRYDQTSLYLIESPSTKAAPLTRVIDKTKPEVANQKGELKIVMALEPSQRDNAPSGNFALASLRFRGKSGASPTTVSCSVESELFSPLGELMMVTSESGKISVGEATLLSAAQGIDTPQSKADGEFVSSLTPPPTISADASGDGVVDMFDLVIWRDHYHKEGYSGTNAGDFNQDELVNGADYAIWLADYHP